MSENWWKHIEGYKQAGDVLLSASNVLGDGRKQYELVHPTLFVYHNYVEVQLKEILVNTRDFLGRHQRFPRTHNIERLWEMCEDVLREVDRQLDPGFTASDGYKEIEDVYDALRANLKAFSDWDPTSQASRFPVDPNGVPILSRLETIDFTALRELIGGVYEKLSGIATGSYTILGMKYEGLASEQQ